MPRRLTRALIVGVGFVLVTCTTAGAQGYVQPGTPVDGKQVESLAERLRADPALMELIQSLQSDPEFERAMEDPDVQGALQSGNTQALLANPKINKLVEHPTVQEITKKVSQ